MTMLSAELEQKNLEYHITHLPQSLDFPAGYYIQEIFQNKNHSILSDIFFRLVKTYTKNSSNRDVESKLTEEAINIFKETLKRFQANANPYAVIADYAEELAVTTIATSHDISKWRSIYIDYVLAIFPDDIPPQEEPQYMLMLANLHTLKSGSLGNTYLSLLPQEKTKLGIYDLTKPENSFPY